MEQERRFSDLRRISIPTMSISRFYSSKQFSNVKDKNIKILSIIVEENMRNRFCGHRPVLVESKALSSISLDVVFCQLEISYKYSIRIIWNNFSLCMLINRPWLFWLHSCFVKHLSLSEHSLVGINRHVLSPLEKCFETVKLEAR